MTRATRILTTLAALGMIAAFVLSAAALRDSASIARHNCVQVQQVRSAIRTVLIRSDRILGTPGSAGYTYYSQHLSELARAHALDRIYIAEFAPQRCS